MAKPKPSSEPEQDPDLERIATARNDRGKFAGRINRFYELAMPHRQPVGSNSGEARDPGEQDDIFDATLQEALDDFVSDMIDFFTPHYKPWVELEPSRKLKTADQKRFEEAIKPYQDALYGSILESSFYSESQECWADLAAAAGGMMIPFAPAGQRIRPQPILCSQLLMDAGPNGELDGRWFEMKVQKRHLRRTFPGVTFTNPDLSEENCRNDSTLVDVVQGCYREYAGSFGKPAWKFCVYVNGEKQHSKTLQGEGAHPIIAMRWRTSPPSMWGPGPGQRGLAPGGALNELSYLFLKHLGKQVDPPMVYDDDGLFNPDAGINAGESYPRMKGSTFDFLLTEQDLRAAFFEQEDLRQQVRRSLYQNKPYQRGETPPTLGQWMDEKTREDRRLQLARMRLYDEWTISALNRFAWILGRRGELPKIDIGGEVIGVRFVNPMSRASDMEDVSRGVQYLEVAIGKFGQQALASIDVPATMDAIKKKMGEGLVVLRSVDEAQQLITQIIANQGGQGGTSGENIQKPAQAA